MTPYRISARERPMREAAAPHATATSLRLIGWLFVIAAVASAVAISIIGGHDVQSAVRIGVWVDSVVAIFVPLVVVAMGLRAAPTSRLRTVAFVTAGAWLAALADRIPSIAGLESYAVAVGISFVRVAAVAGLGLLPFFAASRRVIPRWPLFATIALSAGDASTNLGMWRYTRTLAAQFEPEPSTMAICVLIAYAFLVAARELGDESIDERAERFAPIRTTLFSTDAERSAFLGPVRLATDAVLAFAIAALVATTTTVAYSRSLRLDAPAAGPEVSALVVLVTAALIWLRRSSNGISLAPVVGAVFATLAATFSTMFQNGAAMSVALLPLGVAILGLGVVAPRTRDADARTIRRWVIFVCATGVLLGSAGFFAIYSFGQGEPFLARVAKLAAVAFGVMAATASARLEGHARIELAAEGREP